MSGSLLQESYYAILHAGLLSRDGEKIFTHPDRSHPIRIRRPPHLELGECPLVHPLPVQRHGDVAVEHRGGRVDQRRTLEMHHGHLQLLLTVKDLSKAVHRVVVPRIYPHGGTEACHALIVLLVGEVLVPRERVGVSEGGVDLHCPLEELDGGLGVTLEAAEVTQHAPRLHRQRMTCEGYDNKTLAAAVSGIANKRLLLLLS